MISAVDVDVMVICGVSINAADAFVLRGSPGIGAMVSAGDAVAQAAVITTRQADLTHPSAAVRAKMRKPISAGKAITPKIVEPKQHRPGPCHA